MNSQIRFGPYFRAIQLLEAPGAGIPDLSEVLYDPPVADPEVQKHTVLVLLNQMDRLYDLPYKLAFSTLCSYLRDVMRMHRGPANLIETDVPFGRNLIERARSLLEEIRAELPGTTCPTDRAILQTMQGVCTEIDELYSSMFDDTWCARMSANKVDAIREELMARTWHPSRVLWWMDTDERNYFGF